MTISSGSFSAVGHGVRTQLHARVMQHAYEETGGPTLAPAAEGWRQIERHADDLTRAGLEGLRRDRVGTLIDALG